MTHTSLLTLRGTNWNSDDPHWSRTSYRINLPPADRESDAGMRVRLSGRQPR
jgi:hypothetical protein